MKYKVFKYSDPLKSKRASDMIKTSRLEIQGMDMAITTDHSPTPPTKTLYQGGDLTCP